MRVCLQEPGTAGGGPVSNKTKGKLTWASSSPNVRVEGQGVVRFADTSQHNGNTLPGACAGQKLMAIPGHVPYTKTERFYMPPWAKDPSAMTLPYLRTDLSPADLARFVSEPTVGSCQTCQDLLFMTNCPVRTCGGA